VTFREQAAWWINHVQQRKRKPIAPATVESWQGCLEVWILPNLGDVPLSSVGNLALKRLVEKMVEAGLSAKTVNTYSQVVKSVVASAVNEEGGNFGAGRAFQSIVAPTFNHLSWLTISQ
jgi:hypothetical protein